MSVKIQLGKPPKTFKPFPVSFPMPDGSEGRIECTFRYRTRRDFGVLVATAFGPEAAAAVTGSGDAHQLDIAKAVATSVKKTAAYLVDVLAAWDLDARLDLDSCIQLADEVPAATTAIVQAYARAVTEGHLGN
jgi:hypothetical protein